MDKAKISFLALILIISLFSLNCESGSKGSVLDVEVKGLDGKTYNLMRTKGD